jgi:16S rRNA (guanine527-N7)-methyltransferase
MTVVEGRAEVLARDPRMGGHFAVVTARSFGRPAVTAECAAGYLSAGGALVVSEPPADATIGTTAGRWDTEALASLGLAAPVIAREAGFGFAVMHKVAPADPRYPRRAGIPQKRPLW